MNDTSLSGLEIAVIGMAGRFPGARNIDEFWENLKKGVESIAFYSNEESVQAGAAAELLQDPNYVPVQRLIEERDYFAASFFGYTPTEAGLLTPQARIFHECVWEALEHAGYDPASYPGAIGLYAGASSSAHWEALAALSGKDHAVGSFAAGQLTNKDFLATRIAYKLNLRGAILALQTACSTSLAAVDQACRGLLLGQCDIALAGGVTIITGQSGYLYREGMIASPDGHCRAFDARAKGTSAGEGAGVVVLKPLQEALKDGDCIHAVIKATHVNNDGCRKVGYTAPSVKGQTDVIKTALHLAGVAPRSIGYIEAHGTATPLGDPVEIEALTQAFAADQTHFCAVGSVKSNVGHLDCAAGIAGFIKAVLVLKNRIIPPSLHFESANPAISFESTPFYVSTKVTAWENGYFPRRAGVSSFGIGGTNVHIVLEEWPGEHAGSTTNMEQAPGRNATPDAAAEENILLLLSAMTAADLEKMKRNLTVFLEANPYIDPADLAYTLKVGRRAFKHRLTAECKSIGDAIKALSNPGSRQVKTFFVKEENRPVVFMFPGIGRECVNMGREIYENEPLFRQETERCFEILTTLNKNFSGVKGSAARAATKLDKSFSGVQGVVLQKSPLVAEGKADEAQLILFVFEYALARLLMNRGVVPAAMIGYSFGEYAAAVISGVLSLEDALALVVCRSRLISQTQVGGMVGAPLAREELEPLLKSMPTLSIAIDNGSSCIVAGAQVEIQAFSREMQKQRMLCMPMPAVHAVHSVMMEPILKEYEDWLRCHIAMKKPGIPYISNVTGDWMNEDDAQNPAYWVAHLRQTVRFAAGINKLLQEKGTIFVEIGPGRDLSVLMRRFLQDNSRQQVIYLDEPSKSGVRDTHYLESKIARLWLYGANVDWNKFYQGEKRRRLPLPTYPFTRQYFPISGDSFQLPLSKKNDMADWFYIPQWTRSALLPSGDPGTLFEEAALLFLDETGIGNRLAVELEKNFRYLAIVKPGSSFRKSVEREFTIDPKESRDYDRLMSELQKTGFSPRLILHLWSVSGQAKQPLYASRIGAALDYGYYSLLYLSQAIGRRFFDVKIRLIVVSDHVHKVTGAEELYPAKATLVGAVRAISQEYPNIACKNIDVEVPTSHSIQEERLTRQLAAEIAAPGKEAVTALRGDYRWVQAYQAVRLEKNKPVPGMPVSRLRQEGVYLIVGGLGGIGLTLARFLAQYMHARLILAGRSPLPPRDKWQQWLDSHTLEDSIGQKIRALQELPVPGECVMTAAFDAADARQMKRLVRQAKERFGAIHGVIHAAGELDSGMIQRRTREMSEKIFRPKMYGALVLHQLFKDETLDFFILCSSLNSFFAAPGAAAHAASSNFFDAYAHYCSGKNSSPVLAIDWPAWRQVGMAEKARHKLAGETDISLEEGILPSQGMELFGRILEAPLQAISQLAISTQDLAKLVEQRSRPHLFDRRLPSAQTADMVIPTAKSPRPDLENAYLAPRNETEAALSRIWQSLFGFTQIGVQDDFFDLGGDSLRAIYAAGQVHKLLQVEIPLPEFFSRPTIEQLAQFITHSGKSAYAALAPVEKKQYYALSSAQERLFFLQNYEFKSTAYNMPHVVHLKEDIQLDRVAETFQKIIARHESLRTSFRIIGEQAVQQIHEQVDLKIDYYDRSRSGDNKNKNGEPSLDDIEEVIENFVRPFDLSHAPLVRVGLVTAAAKRQILLFDLHHIISDGASQDLLKNEFLEMYHGLDFSPLPLQYRDYAQWQNSRRFHEIMQKQERYWLNLFAGEPPVLHLPTDFPRPMLQSFAGLEINFSFNPEETARLRQIAKDHEATFYMTLFALFDILFMKLSGQEDIVVGTPAAARRSGGLEQIIGMFANTLALRIYPTGEKTFREFLQEVKKQTLDAYQNQEYPFEALVEKISIRKDTGRNPLFDAMFSYWNRVEYAGDIAEITGETAYRYKKRTALFDLNLTAIDVGETLYFKFEFCTQLFKPDTIRRFTRYFREIAACLMRRENSTCKLSAIEILADEEKKEILRMCARQEEFFPTPHTVHRFFEAQTAGTPDRIALLEIGLLPARQFTYSLLNREANRLAWFLGTQGVTVDTLVAVILERSFEMIAALLAVLKAGGAYLPIDTVYPEKRILTILADSQAALVLSQDTAARSLSKTREDKAGLPCMNPRFFLLDRDSESLTQYPGENPGHTGKPGDLLYVIYTSGSTGQPKGVMLEHGNFVNLVNYDFTYTNMDFAKMLQFHSIGFDASHHEIYCALLSGGRLYMIDNETRLNIPLLLRIVGKHKIKTLFLPMSMLRVIFEPAGYEKQIPRCLKHIQTAGEQVVINDRFRGYLQQAGVYLHNHYGPSETHVVTALTIAPDGTIPKLPTIGASVSNTAVYILDKGNQLAPIGAAGELWAAGVQVGRGYLDNPELTAEKFASGGQEPFCKRVPGLPKTFNKSFCGGPGGDFLEKSPLVAEGNKIYKTGDLARLLPDGNIEFLGRIDQQIKIRGYRVEPGEIETLLLNHEKIAQALVLARENEKGEKYLCVYISPLDSQEDLTVELRDYLAKELPDYMIPAYFVFIDKLPLTSGGKIDRQALPLPAPSMKPGARYIPPADALEEKLTQIWADVLGIGKNIISMDADFFALGGHSLKAAILAAGVLRELNVELLLKDIFRAPTIRGMAGYAKKLVKTPYTALQTVETKEYYPLSSAQKRLYFLQQLDADNFTYHLPYTVVLPETIQAERLENIFKSLVARHESLRTSFQVIGNDPGQRIHAPDQAALEIEYYAAGSTPGNPSRIIQEFVRPFDLARAPLLRIGCIRSHEAPAVLILDMHHIISDGLSQDILTREFLAAAAAEPLSPLRLQYKDYSAWKAKDNIKQQEAFWLAQYKDKLPILHLPTDAPRPVVQSFAGKTIETMIDRSVLEELRSLMREENATLFMTLFAVFTILLAKLSGQEEFVVGTPTAGRRHPDLAGVVGMFVNTLALRCFPTGAKTFREYVGEIKRYTLDAFENQEYPFEDLLEKLPLARDVSRNPLFDAMFRLQDFQAHGQELSGIAPSPYKYENPTAKFDLVLSVDESLDSMRITCEYSTHLFKEQTIHRYMDFFKRLVSLLTHQPGTSIAEIELLSPAERRQMLDVLNAPPVPYPQEQTIHGLFAEQVSKSPHRTALVEVGEEPGRTQPGQDILTLSYRELEIQSDRFAKRLQQAGCAPHSIAAIITQHPAAMVIGILGILKAGGAYLPIDPEFPEERIKYMLADSAADFLLTNAPLFKEVETLHSLEIETISIDEIGDAAPDAIYALVSSRAPAYVIYTSGTTGRPKGSLIEHGNVVNLMVNDRHPFDFGQNDVWTLFHSFSFDFSVWEMYGALLYGGKSIVFPRWLARDAGKFLELLKYQSVTILNQTPGAFYRLAAAVLACPQAQLALRCVIFGGEALSPARLRGWQEKYPQTRLINMYGITETTVHVTYKEICAPEIAADSGNIGKPIPNLSAYIAGQYLEPLPLGAPGELCVGGKGISRGYLNRLELTAEKFVSNNNRSYKSYRSYRSYFFKKIYRTGDLARLLPDGAIEFLGRIDQQIKIRGYRIETTEIENRLMQSPSVREAAVIVLEDASGDKQLAAYVVAASAEPGPQSQTEARADEPWLDEIRRMLQATLPHYMVPHFIVPLAALPRTTGGKIDRQALPAPRTWLTPGAAPPANEVEEIVAAIWQEVLGIPKVGVTDNFFELGGDSIKVIQVAARLQKHRLKLDIKDLFLYPTIRQSANRLTPMEQAKASPAPVGQVEPTPIQRWFFNTNPEENAHFNHAVMLYRRQGFNETLVRKVFTCLAVHHDALRMVFRFERGPGGNRVTQWNRDAQCELFHLEVFDLAGQADAEMQIREQAGRIQASINLSAGPLVKLGLFKTLEGDHLLIAIHHLVVDGISWRILLEDFEIGYRQALQGEEIHFQDKTASFQAWSRALQDYASSRALSAELPYWQKIEKTALQSLPRERQIAAELRKHKNCRTVYVRLAETETALLTTQANRAYRTEINDLLLAGLAAALRGWSGLELTAINLETHGREPIIPGIDISRTVGWFTAQFPLLLDLSQAADPASCIIYIKETLRRVPHKGCSYGVLKYLTTGEKKIGCTFTSEPEISFNYLGQFSQPPKDAVVQFSRLETGASSGPDLKQAYTLNIGGMQVGGELLLSFTYNRYEYEEAAIRRLADGYISHLQQLIGHCVNQKEARLTPSDVGDRELSIAELDYLQHLFRQEKLTVEKVYPLTPMQSGILFHALQDRRSYAYFQQLELTIAGEIETDVFCRAAAAIISKYDIPRTAFVYEKLRLPRQVVLENRQAPVFVEDISNKTGEQQRSYLETLKQADKDKSFDLVKGPLLRFMLLRSHSSQYKLIVSFHHLLLDGWSLGLLYKELLDTYSALLQNPDQAPTAKEALQFDRYVQWLAGQDKQAGLAYWQEYLAGYETRTPPPQNYHTVSGAASRSEYRLKRLRLDLSEELSHALRRTAENSRTTPNAIFQTSWGFLLHRYNDCDDALFGAVVSGRSAAIQGIENMLGVFINTIPVRVTRGNSRTFRQLLQQVHQQAILAKSWEFIPLVEIQSRSLLKRDLIDHIMIFENYPLENTLAAGTTGRDALFSVQGMEFFEQTNFDFNIMISPGDRFSIFFSYNATVFAEELVERTGSHLENLLQIIVKTPDMAFEEIDFLTPQEREQILVAFNDTRTPYPDDRTIHDLFGEQAKQIPDRIALLGPGLGSCSQSPDKSQQAHISEALADLNNLFISYRELDKRSDRLARLLLGKGVCSETVIAILVERSLEILLGIFGVLKAGGAYLPLDPEFPANRTGKIMAAGRAKILLSSRSAAASLSGQRTAETLPGCDHDPELLYLDDEKDFRAEEAAALPPVASHDLAYVMFTSGTTGSPKGVMITHRNVCNFFTGMSHVIDSRAGDAVLSLTTAAFDIFALETLLPLVKGAAVVLGSREEQLSPAAAARCLTREQVTIVQMTPARLQLQLSAAPPISTSSPACLRYLLVGGETFPAPLLEKARAWTNARIFNLYGPTETTIWSTAKDVTSAATLTIGKPIANTQVYIMNKDRTLQPPGAAGKLYIGGCGVARGYYGNEKLTAEKFIPNTYRPGEWLYDTGDFARWLPNGDIDFLGRLDQQLKIRGFRIEPAEIEEQLLKHEEIKEALLIALDHKNEAASNDGGPRLCAYFVLKGAAAQGCSAAELRDFLSRELPPYMIPSYFIPLEKIPLTPNGKLDRKALPLPAEMHTESGSPWAAPDSKNEKLIAAAWKEILQVDKIGVHDNFFDLGGNSIDVIRLSSRLQELFKREIPVVALFRHLTIRSLADYLQDNQGYESRLLQEIDAGIAAGKEKTKNRMAQRLRRVKEQ